MLEKFSNVIPGSWFDEAGMSKSGYARESFHAKLERRWQHVAKKMSMSVVSAAALVMASLTISTDATASNLMEFAAPPGMSPLGHAPGPLASPGEINKSFKELFTAFREGANLITNDKTRLLAEKAAARRNERPEGWARKLASDTEDAND